jgi:D-lyxose ketol-isomerase
LVKIKRKNLDGLVVTHWRFEKIGDNVPMHNHLPEINNVPNVGFISRDDHISILVKGKIHATGTGWEMVLESPGEIINFLPNHPHEFKALEDDSILINIRKGLVDPNMMDKIFDAHQYDKNQYE